MTSEFESAIAALVETSLNTSCTSIDASHLPRNASSTSLSSSGEANGILENALRASHLNQSFMYRGVENPPIDEEVSEIVHISERILYLEWSVASMQNATHGYMEEISQLTENVKHLEIELSKFQQYNRRESMEISGIPEYIPQDIL